MAARDLEPQLFMPRKWFWIVGPTYDLAEKEFRVIWDDLIVGQKLGRDKRVKKSYNKKQGDMYIEFPWGTRLECRSAQHPDNLVGEGLDGVIMSEAAKQQEETWKRHIRPALTDKRGWASFPTTPEGTNWLYRMWQMGNNPDHPLYEAWSFPSWKNTAIYPKGYEDEEIQDLLRTTVKEWFDQEIGADFTSFVGKIYGAFREGEHVRRLGFNPAWPYYIAFDWGFTNPLAAVEFQVGPNDQIHVWRIHYKAYTTVAEHCRIMKARPQPVGYHINMCFGDAADPEAALVVTQNLAPCITDPKAKENWRQGVDLINMLLQPYQIGVDEDGAPIEEPKLLVDFDCSEIIDEFNNYKAKKPANGNNVPEVGQKTKDHALDALRYGLMHVLELGCDYHLNDIMGQALYSQPSNAGMFTSEPVGQPTWQQNESGIFTMGGRF
jgi:hypothetical protein